MSETPVNQGWRQYASSKVIREGERYKTSEGEWLFLYEHPVTRLLGGVPESGLDRLRWDFALWLRERLEHILAEPASRPEKLEKTAELLYELLRQSPPPHDWLRLPADSRPGRNRSTLAYHSLLVSAFACAMARAWIARGKPVSELLRFQVPVGKQEQPVDVEELIHFIRIASLCHDFGKHPPQRHHERGKEQVRELFSGLIDELVVFSLSEAAYRHHTARSYRMRGESPIGSLEELIAHADTLASAADRPVMSEDPDPVRAATHFLREELGDEKALSLISADTDRVKSYVFESARLPEVRGASALLTQLNEERIRKVLWNDFQLPPECLLYAAGGSALIVTPTALAEDLSKRIQHLYLQETRTATISVVHRPTSPREWVKGVEASEGNFGNLVKWMGYDLRRAKESRVFYPLFDAPPYARRCDSCEVRPATHQMLRFQAGEEEKWVCDVCARKRKRGKDEKSGYIKAFEDFLEEDADQRQHTDGKYWRAIVEHGGRDKVIGAKTLEEIGRGAEGKAKGYVGVIYTDGNDIGSRIEGCVTPAEYRTVSEELLRVTKEATFRALARQMLLKEVKCSDGQRRWIHPFEIVAIGGDDVFLIVPGDVALDIAMILCQEFEQQFNKKLTMSAGVLIMHAHFPIYLARGIVEMLLKNAKKAGRKARRNSDDTAPAYIDFQVITGDSSLGDDLEEYRRQFYSAALPLTEFLIQRPYPLQDLQRILNVVRWAKREQFPASQLYQLRQAIVEHNRLWSQNWYHYQLAREGTTGQQWREFHHQLFVTDPLTDAEAPWQYDGNRWTTPILDLVEILDYVRSNEGGVVGEIGN